MSELQVNKISPRSGAAITLGDSGDTFTIPAGATITNSGTATGFGGGKLLQCAYTTSTFAQTTSSGTDSLFVDSAVTITFTPTTTASKFIVFFSVGMAIVNDPDDFGWGYKIKKTQSGVSTNPSGLSEHSGAGNPHTHGYIYENTIANWNNYQKIDNFMGVDADAHTTAAITYTVQFCQFNAGTNLKVGNANNVRPQMIVQEVAN